MDLSVFSASACQDDRLGRVQSLVRAFGLLEALAENPEGMTLTEAAQAIALPRSTVHRLLTTMESLRFVAIDPKSNRWQVGIQAFAVGSAFAESRDLARLGKPIMNSLMRETSETINVSVIDGAGIHFLAQVTAVQAASTPARLGGRLPLHSTAAGKVMLANWSDHDLDELLRTTELRRYTDRTITDAANFRQQLRTIASNGFAVDDQENAPGIRCIAAPLFDSNGQVRAALSISSHCTRVPDDRIGRLGTALAAAAHRMSSDLGHALAL